MRLIYFTLTVLLLSAYASDCLAVTEDSLDEAHKQLLKSRFEKQHEQLIPVVAVADMFFSCNRDTQGEHQYSIDYLVQEMDKQELAEKLQACLGESNLKSDKAINYGLLGCFHEQLASLPEAEKAQKMKLVRQAISSLSRDERQKSLTHCVTDQAIKYLK